MIGQVRLMALVGRQIDRGTFPRFSILRGPAEEARHEVAVAISDELNAVNVTIDKSVDSIRKMIATAYQIAAPAVFIIDNAETMSQEAANALLKVTEEPPQQAYFILLTSGNALATLYSRAQVYYMEGYTRANFKEYLKSKNARIPPEELEIVHSYCQTLSQVDLLQQYGILTFQKFIENVVEFAPTVNVANALKIGAKIGFKGEPELYDYQLFFHAVLSEFYRAQSKLVESKGDSSSKLWDAIGVTASIIESSRREGVKKDSLFDTWIFAIQNIWRK